jgi:hypothetical protein
MVVKSSTYDHTEENYLLSPLVVWFSLSISASSSYFSSPTPSQYGSYSLTFGVAWS